MNELYIASPAFGNGEKIPMEYSGFGEDISPMLQLKNLSPEAVSLAVIMDDLDVPFCKTYTH